MTGQTVQRDHADPIGWGGRDYVRGALYEPSPQRGNLTKGMLTVEDE